MLILVGSVMAAIEGMVLESSRQLHPHPQAVGQVWAFETSTGTPSNTLLPAEATAC